MAHSLKVWKVLVRRGMYSAKPLIYQTEAEALAFAKTYTEMPGRNGKEIKVVDTTTNKIFEYKVFENGSHVETVRVIRAMIHIQ